MRIAVASDDGVDVAAHTGRCQGFVIFEIAGQDAVRTEYRTNSYTAHAQGRCTSAEEQAHAHHTHGPLLNALADCRVLVTRGLGPRLIADLAARGVEAYVCAADQAEEAARQYAQGRLPKAAGCGCCGHR